MIALADRRQILLSPIDVKFTAPVHCCDTSLDLIDSKHDADHIQVLDYAALNQVAVRPCSI